MLIRTSRAMRRVRILWATVLVAATITVLPVATFADHLPRPDKLVILELLLDGNFPELNELLTAYQEQFETGHAKDYDVGLAFASFANSDPRVTRRLNQWVEEFPQSFVPFLARGIHHANLGIHYRGTKYYNRTHRKALEKMREHFDRAVADTRQALSSNKKLTKAYDNLLDIALYQGPHRGKRGILEEALKHAPQSFLVRESYLVSLHPSWGGSLEEIRAFLDESKQSGFELGALEGYGDYARAEELARSGRRWEAIEYYDRALEYGEWSLYRYNRANNLYWGKIGDHGVSDSALAVELAPQWPSVLALRAMILTRLGQIEEARRFWAKAIELDTLSPYLLGRRAWWFRNQHQNEEAVADYDNALVYGAFDGELYRRRAILHFGHPERHHLAQADLRRVVELEPDNAEARWEYANSLNSLNPYAAGCDAIEAFESYLKFCAKTGRCSESGQKSARFFVDDRTGSFNKCLEKQ